MNGGASPEVIVAIQAEIGDLKAKLADAQASIQKSTAQMAQTVETNNPFKKLHEAMRAGGVAIGIHTVTNALSGMANALNEINQGASPFEAFLYNAPLGLGNLARSASDFSIALLNMQEFFAKENPIWASSGSAQAADKRAADNMARLMEQWDIESAIGEEARAAAKLKADQAENERNAAEKRLALEQEIAKLTTANKKPQYSAESMRYYPNAQKEMREYENEQARIDGIRKRREREIANERDILDTIAESRHEKAMERINSDAKRRQFADERQSLNEELSAAREQLAAIKANKGTESISTAIGAFTIAQTGQDYRAEAMLKLQEKIRDLLAQIAENQRRAAENGGPI